MGHLPEAVTKVDNLVRSIGTEDVPVDVPGLGKWSVPRRYIGLHGLVAADLPDLAERYGWVKL